MKSITLANGTDLASWANRLDAQSQFPRLIRRLVLATLGRPMGVSFRAGEGVLLGGWDGVVSVEAGNAFVPDGVSGWELGTNKGVKGKADSDYKTRTEGPDDLDRSRWAFVFVTPRRWSAKERWAATKSKEGVWREVRAYDADDLEAWLELAPAVHVWLSILLGKHPEGVVDLETHWADWSEATRPPIGPELVLAGRRECAEQIHDWLRGPSPPPLAIRADSRDESLAVFAAALLQLPPDEREAQTSRTLIVQDVPAWQGLTASAGTLNLIPLFDHEGAVSRAVRSGHRVVVPLGRSDGASSGTLAVPRLSREEAFEALVTRGVDEIRARGLASLARRSLTSFRRKIALSPEVQQPPWARPAEAMAILPLMLAGGWSDPSEGDREALASLAMAPYEQVSRTATRWANESDPPVRRVGDAWFVVSREDAWGLLARFMTPDYFGRFEAVVLQVIGTVDPRFELPPDRRWLACPLGHAPRHSGLLRKGLADSLALLGAWAESAPGETVPSSRDLASRIVRRLLGAANADGRLWASLSRELPLLAEAAPSDFLSAVEAGLVGEEPVLVDLFRDQGDPLFSDSPHVGLLWALENLTWSPDHLGHAAILLARLARLDPGGRVSNCPQRSLRDVFRPWVPQTRADLGQRLRVLDTIRVREPKVSWRLLHQLLPEHHAAGEYTHRPRWRDWGPDATPRAIPADYPEAVREILSRMLSDAGASGARWGDLVDAVSSLPGDLQDRLIDRLRDLDITDWRDEEREPVRAALRQLLSHQRSFPEGPLAMPGGRVERLAEIYERFRPVTSSDVGTGLFKFRPELPDGYEGDWRTRSETLARGRLEAVRDVHAQSGVQGVLELASRVETPEDVGFSLGKSGLAETEEDDLLRENLASSHPSMARFARGFAFGRFSAQGASWALIKLHGPASTWSPIPDFSPGEWNRAALCVIGGVAPTIYGTRPRQPDDHRV